MVFLLILLFIVAVIFILPTAFLLFIIQSKKVKYAYFIDLINSSIYKMTQETMKANTREEPPVNNSLTRKEALEILGLPESADKKQINDAYYKLVQVLHPDKGGSTYLTQKLNQAREILTKN